MIKAGIVGATGYAGAELVRLLAGHPYTSIEWLVSKSYVGQSFSSIYGNMFNIISMDCTGDDLYTLADSVDVIFTATPQGYLSQSLTPDILSKTKVIDLSADYRLSDVSVYEKWYGIEHGSPALIKNAVYGLCELYRDDIRNTRLVANPGCFPTGAILSSYPLVKNGLVDRIIIDSKTGVSGAGVNPSATTHYPNIADNVNPYKISSHRHMSEIQQELHGFDEVKVSFTPHLVPVIRGIQTTSHSFLNDENLDITPEELRELYEKEYGEEYFIKLMDEGEIPHLSSVRGSNFVHIGVFEIDETGRLVMLSCIDNLVKGASGQAIQNMNLIMGIDETSGLTHFGLHP